MDQNMEAGEPRLEFDRNRAGVIFRERLTLAMRRADMNQSDLARRAGIDRSTLSQLLAGRSDRLPRAETVACVALTLKVGTDWLLGLSNDARSGARIIRESVQIAHRDTAQPSDENIRKWHAESAGTKVRYVPSTLPDLMKTDRVLSYEYGDYLSKSPDQAKTATAAKLAYSRMPESDMETCFSLQSMRGFAAGENIWSGLPEEARREQLRAMAKLARELYPRLRVFLFDGLAQYSVPYTIFGTKRAALFVGQMYFVFNTAEHVQNLISHFDDLIRSAVVQAHEFAEFAEKLAEE